MTRLATALIRWACDPAKLEALEGDFVELYGCEARGGDAWRDALSIVLRHSRFTTARARRRARRAALVAAAAAVVMLAADAAAAPARWTVDAADPAGRFTLAFERLRVVGATIDDVPVDPARLVQSGSTLVIKGGDGGRDFRLSVKPGGGVTWEARQP